MRSGGIWQAGCWCIAALLVCTLLDPRGIAYGLDETSAGQAPAGGSVAIYCPVCGARNSTGSRFCLKDGSALPKIDQNLYRRDFVRASETYSSVEVQAAINKAAASVVRVRAKLEEDAIYPVARTSRWPGRSYGHLDLMKPGDTAAGSGFAVGAHGEVVTNAHVAAPLGARAKLTVETQDGRIFPATLIGLDEPSDLALLKAETGSLQPLPWADEQRLHLGEETWAVGNPLDIGISVTRGTISSVGRLRLGMNQVESYVHSDAFITQGNSGGPLLTVLGEAVGVSAVGFHHEKGQGYSIPSTMARLVIERLRRDGAYRRGFLGLHVSPISPALREEYSLKRTQGLVVKSILPGTPGATGGFREGDVLFGINGRFAPSAYLMQEAVSTAGPGSPIEIRLDRAGNVMELSVTTALRPAYPRIDPILHYEELLNGSFEEAPAGDGIIFHAPDRFSIARHYGLRDKVRFREVIPAEDWPNPEAEPERRTSRRKRSSKEKSRRTEVLDLDSLREALKRSYVGQRIAVTFILELEGQKGVSIALDETWPIVL